MIATVLKPPKQLHRPYHVNYLQGFWLKLVSDIIKRTANCKPAQDFRSLFKGRFSFKLQWEHVVIAFLLGMLMMNHGSSRILKLSEPAPAVISVKPLPLLKEASYAPQTLAEPVWIDKRRPTGTYGNTYAWGNCTAYVAGRLPIPNNWGNANQWAYSASLAGYQVAGTPKVGSIAQTTGDSWLGHVAIVEEVYPDGSFLISEMNAEGLGVVDSRSTTTAEFPTFIYV